MAFDEKEYKRLKQQQADKEEQLILGSSRQFGIYQLRDDAENIRDLAFEGMDWLRKKGLFVDADNYELVYVDSLDGVDLGFRGSVLDDLYERFNLERPEDFVGHSLSESVYVDGVSKWSNDVKKGEKPVLKAVRGLTDQFITDLYKTQLSNEQAAEIICRFFQEADAGIAASKEDIYGMLEEQIDAHLYGNSLEEPEIRNDRDYVLTLRSRMNSNLRDMEEVLTDIYKVMRMRDLSHTDLSEDMQKALLDFEVCAVYQKRDLIRTDDFLRAEDRTLLENDKTDKGGQLHGEYGTDEVSGAGAGNTGRLCFGGDSGENGRSGEKGEQGNDGTQRRVRKPVEEGGRQSPEGDPAQVHGRSDVEAFQARLFMELTGHDMDGKAADHAGALRFDFEDIFNTINDGREKYHNAMNGILLSTIYGPVELSTVTKDENGKFGLSEDYYTGKLAEDEERIRRGHMVAFNKYEIVGVRLPDENRLIYENSSLVNPAFDEFVREQELGNSMDGVTFTGYVSGQKQGFEVTFFKDENGEPQFYVTDSGEYSIAKGGGVIPDDFSFDWGNALLLLQNLNMGFENPDDCIIVNSHDRDRTDRLIRQSMEAPLPVELTISVIDDGVVGKNNRIYFCDELTAKCFSDNVRREMTENAGISGIDREFQIEIRETGASDIHLDETKDKLENDRVKEYYGKPDPDEEVIEKFRERTDELFHAVDDQTPENIEQMVLAHVREILADYDMEAEAVDAVMTGSRCRGLEREDSDLDVVVEIHGTEREDILLDVLNNEWFATGGVKIDIIPITPEKTGTLAEYLPRVEQYLEDKAKEMALSEKTVQEKEQKREVCMPAGSLYSAFKIRRRVEDERYHLIADVKLPDGEIRKAQVIGEFEDHAAISGFCKKNGIVYDDITNDLKNRIEKKRQKSGGRDIQQPDPRHKKNRGAEMDDDK